MKRTLALILAALLALGVTFGALAEAADPNAPVYDGNLIIKDGLLQPMTTLSDFTDETVNANDKGIYRFCVYVETDNDTDNDGKADLVKALVQVPRSAAQGVYKAAAIYDPTPYSAGTYEDKEAHSKHTSLYVEEPFNYDDLYRECEKRTPEGVVTTLEAVQFADPNGWIYSVPISGEQGYYNATNYNYFLIRGYAVVLACGIGTYGSEGFELCGTHLERDSHRAVIEWLTGDRVAYIDKTSNIAIDADWCNGKVAMTGTSYGGTLPFSVATTGVKGLETIIPFAGIASWYNYTNSQGVPTQTDVNYADSLAAFNCGATFLDIDWTVPNREYGSWLWQISEDQNNTNGDYGPIWEESDYARQWQDIKCSALVVTGLNDFNVNAVHADKMVQAFTQAGQNVKLVLHQDGHNDLSGRMVNGELWNVTMNRWLAHYLYGVDNGAENMPAVLVQSNVDGSWQSYDSWRDFDYIEASVKADTAYTQITSAGLNDIASKYILESNPDLNGMEHKDEYFMALDDAHVAVYPIELPENTTLCGVPEVHVRLSNENYDYNGLMISAALIDRPDDGKPFPAYMVKSRLGDTLPLKVVGTFDDDFDTFGRALEYVQDYTKCKAISYGYTDLADPGRGYDIAEYTGPSDRVPGEFYDYTFYMIPTCYTVQPGHTLYLYLTTWDPYCAYLDRDFVSLNLDKPTDEIQIDYSYTVDNASIKVMVPVK